MTPSELLFDEVWEELPVRATHHSRLYPLEPIGIGRPLVESLTSYMMRLADAHSLTPLSLLAGECLPLMRPSFYKEGKLLHCHLNNDWWRHAATTMNGLNPATSDWVTLLERLTMRDDLSHLTLLPWQPVLSSRELIRRERAWCSRCYAEWQADGLPSYDPLLWMLKVVTHCPHHGCELTSRCPHPECGRLSLALSSRGQPGFCGYCFRWLGSSTFDVQTGPSDALWIAAQAGSMLAAQHALPESPNPEYFRQALRQASRAYGGMTLLAAQLKTHHSVLHHWLTKPQTWQLASVLRVITATGMSPLELFTGKTSSRSEPLDAIPQMLLPQVGERPARPFDRAYIRAALEAVLVGNEDPPPSMEEVARRLDYHRSFLSHRFPALCSAISARYAQARSVQSAVRLKRIRTEVRQAVYTLHEQGVFPANAKVQALIGRFVLQEQPIYEYYMQLKRDLGYY